MQKSPHEDVRAVREPEGALGLTCPACFERRQVVDLEGAGEALVFGAVVKTRLAAEFEPCGGGTAAVLLAVGRGTVDGQHGHVLAVAVHAGAFMEVVGEAVALDVSGPDGLDAPDVADHVRDLLLAVEEVLAFLLKGFATGEKKGGEGGADDQSALHMHG